MSTAKNSKPQHYHPNKFDNFSRDIKVEFWDKNGDFEQCVFSVIAVKLLCSKCLDVLVFVGKKATNILLNSELP